MVGHLGMHYLQILYESKRDKHSSLLCPRTKKKIQMYNTDARTQCYKTFYTRNLQMFEIAGVYVSSGPTQLSLMLVGKTRSQPQIGELQMGFTWKGFSISHKHQTRLEGSSGEKHPSLLQTLINYRCKKFQYIIVQVNTFLEDVIYAYCSNVYMTALSCSFKPYLEGNLSYNNTIIDNQYPLCCVCGGYAGSQCIATWGQCYKTFYSHKLLLFIISQSLFLWQAFLASPNHCK